MFFRAQTTARTQKRQVRVLKSKYDIYSLSGLTKYEVIRAAIIAIHKTAFRFINLIALYIKTPLFIQKGQISNEICPFWCG